MHLAFVGDVSKDVNVVKGQEEIAPGGGVLFGAIAAARLGLRVQVFTKCAEADRALFAGFETAGAKVVFLPSATSTSCRNVYPSDNPDERQTSFASRAEPFRESELADVAADVVHVNPLYLGQFPPELLPVVRRRARLLGGDAQGFTRIVGEDGSISHGDWPEKERWLPYFDLFKVDLKEAQLLTGLDQPGPAARRLREWGARVVLLTHQRGVCVYDGAQLLEAEFGPYALEGRTGRGDTCTAAFWAASRGGDFEAAVREAARVTTAKMQYPGPYRG